ncbi:MAG TPA: hypothetical protein VF452_21975, partial [Candidatus Binatia bacterium]
MIDGKFSSRSAGFYAAQAATLRLLATVAISFAFSVQCPFASAQEKERHVSLGPGETVTVWFGANYGRRCATA